LLGRHIEERGTVTVAVELISLHYNEKCLAKLRV